MNIGIIGCGLIGKKRANNISKDDVIISCCDINEDIGNDFSEKYNCKYYQNYKDLIKYSDVDIIIISVINKFVKNIVYFALNYNKHVLIEKPMGLNYNESLKILNQYKKINNKKIKVGFNHRFHPAIIKAKQIYDNNDIGDIMYIRGRYGHGGRNGMENEWRSSKELCGGGELLDQGVHMIDLSNYFLNEKVDSILDSIFGKVTTKFWNIDVEDNAFIHMTTKSKIDIQLHVSWTEWKNIFNFEIFGTKGYLKINGLGGSYGTESLEIGNRRKEGGIPYIKLIEYNEDDSWKKEWEHFKYSIMSNIPINGGVIDGLNANKIIKYIYKSSKENKIIKI